MFEGGRKYALWTQGAGIAPLMKMIMSVLAIRRTNSIAGLADGATCGGFLIMHELEPSDLRHGCAQLALDSKLLVKSQQPAGQRIGLIQ